MSDKVFRKIYSKFCFDQVFSDQCCKDIIEAFSNFEEPSAEPRYFDQVRGTDIRCPSPFLSLVHPFCVAKQLLAQRIAEIC